MLMTLNKTPHFRVLRLKTLNMPKLRLMAIRVIAVSLLMLTFPVAVSAQARLSGVLLDSLTNEPVPFATVYLDGTSSGDVTADDGTFTLGPVIPPATLIVSHLNYHNKSIALGTASGPLTIRLRARDEVLAGVEVIDKDLRARNLKEFKKLLLGSDEWGVKSSLMNDVVLRFERDYVEKKLEVRNDRVREKLLERNHPDARWSSDGKSYFYSDAASLRATTRSPLRLRLPHLGYTVSMDLNSFLAEYRSGRMMYLGTFFFQPDEKIKARHRKNRQRAYLGSTMHFARALLADSLVENGFQVMEIRKDTTTGKEVIGDVDLQNHLEEKTNGVRELSGLAGRAFAVLYYADARFRPLPVHKRRKIQPVQSRFDVTSDRCILLPGGVFGDAGIGFSGYMGTRGMAWILPMDYVPEE